MGKKTMKKIDPNAIYSAADLRAIIGKRGLDNLRAAGLRAAIGRKYFGEKVLDAIRATSASRTVASGNSSVCQVGPEKIGTMSLDRSVSIIGSNILLPKPESCCNGYKKPAETL